MPDPSLVLLSATRSRGATPIVTVTAKSWPGIECALDQAGRNWLRKSGFTGQAGKHGLLPDKAGNLEKIFYGLAETPGDPFEFARLARVLPEGNYRIDGDLPDKRGSILGWLPESYRFERFRHADHEKGHGWCCECPGSRPDDHGSEAQAAPACTYPGRRELDLRQCLPSG